MNYAQVFFVDCESYESADNKRSQGVNASMIAFNNCIYAMYQVSSGNRPDMFVPYDSNKFTNFFREYLGGKN